MRREKECGSVINLLTIFGPFVPGNVTVDLVWKRAVSYCLGKMDMKALLQG